MSLKIQSFHPGKQSLKNILKKSLKIQAYILEKPVGKSLNNFIENLQKYL